jgi:polygalacturonase
VDVRRREFLRLVTVGLVAGSASTCPIDRSIAHEADGRVPFNVRSFGATGDGKTVDTLAVNRAIATAAASGGGRAFPDGCLRLSFHSAQELCHT